MPRSIASLSLSFGLVSIPVKLYSATESASTVRFNLLAKDGSRVRQQYVSEKDQRVVDRKEMVKGYEFEKDRFVLFTPEELKALEEGSSSSIDIVAFIPLASVDPIYYDKAYYLAPDKRGGKPYALLDAAMKKSGRCALAKWAWKARQYVVQVRCGGEGLILQQLLYADEVRSMKELEIEHVEVSASELALALQLIDQISRDDFDPTEFVDEEKQRVLAEIDRKIAGKQIVASEPHAQAAGSNVIDLMDALRASLQKKPAKARQPEPAASVPADGAKDRKPIRRASKASTPAAAPEALPARVRARR